VRRVSILPAETSPVVATRMTMTMTMKMTPMKMTMGWLVGYFSSDFDTVVVTIAIIEHIQTNPLTHASRLPLPTLQPNEK